MEQKRFDFRLLSPALRNLWLFLVYSILIMIHDVRLSSTRSANQLLSEMSQTRLTVLEMQCTRLLNKLCSRRFSPMLRLTESFWRESYDTGLSIRSVPHPTKATALPIFFKPERPDTNNRTTTKEDLKTRFIDLYLRNSTAIC